MQTNTKRGWWASKEELMCNQSKLFPKNIWIMSIKIHSISMSKILQSAILCYERVFVLFLLFST